ncbi:IQ domain-containing protein M isoform X3 [Canis lupus dingo]|uniref:IQ domain-containing protein M isoform X3 n=1 Tax=Canis lupus dingo TaxID=286419 RepID=UPI000DC6657B|nr:IQ domain-containing protein M isoform X3 [Canis lupus dingo]
MSDKAECPILEITRQDFFQEAKTLIAQHYEKINENKVQGTSINVFKNKHQKPKSGKFIPLVIKKKETPDMVQELRTAHKNICFPKHLFKSEHFKEPSQGTSFKEPYIFSVKEKFKDSMDIIAKDKTFSDWRGIVSTKTSRLAPHSSWPSLYGSSSVFRDYCSKTVMKKEQQPIKPEPKPGTRIKSILSKSGKLDNKVKRIGPHIEIFQVFRERTKFVNIKKVVKMVILMQAYVRGWLERKRFQRIMVKALSHGPNLRAVINMYHRLIHRVKYRLGLWRTRQIINFAELEEWMDRKKFYETMFAKREDWQGLERSELLKFFNDCGHFPTQQQIDEVWDLVHREDRDKYSELIKKFNAIEMLFTLYPPQGAHVRNNVRLKSTWLRPIVNGEEGYRYIVNGHPILKRANIQVVGKLVCRSIRERKMRQHLS